MRGIISCAMLAALEDLGYTKVFDAIYGGSSGSVNAAYILAGGLWHSLSIYYDDLASRAFIESRAFIDLRRVFAGRALLDVDYAFDMVFELTNPSPSSMSSGRLFRPSSTRGTTLNALSAPGRGFPWPPSAARRSAGSGLSTAEC